MPIVSSTIIEDRVQAGGRRAVTELHVDGQAGEQRISYLAESGANIQAVMAARVTNIDSRLREREIRQNLVKAYAGQNDFTFNHSTVAQIRTALRELFRISTKMECVTWGWAIQSLGLSDNQLKALFEKTDAQLPALKSRLAALSAKYMGIDSEVGE